MKLTQYSRIYDPKQWGTHEKSFAFSADGQLVAVRLADGSSDKDENVFVYGLNGNNTWSFRSQCSGEQGIAFWPDKYHLLVPGCDDHPNARKPDQDGLKKYAIGSTEYQLEFADRLNGINIHVRAASDDGKYLLAEKKDKLYGLSAQATVNFPKVNISEAYFAPGAEMIGFTSFNAKSGVLKGEQPAQPMELDEDFVCFLSAAQMVTSKRTHLSLWNSETMTKVREVPLTRSLSQVFSGAATSDGKLIAVNDNGGGISLWSGDALALLGEQKLPDGQNVARMRFSFDGRFLLTIIMGGDHPYDRKEVVIWNVEQGNS